MLKLVKKEFKKGKKLITNWNNLIKIHKKDKISPLKLVQGGETGIKVESEYKLSRDRAKSISKEESKPEDHGTN